jgi:hypothetical protein
MIPASLLNAESTLVIRQILYVLLASGDAYGNFTERDLLIWTRETEKLVAEDSRIFHSGDSELRSLLAVCHCFAEAVNHPSCQHCFCEAVAHGRILSA